MQKDRVWEWQIGPKTSYRFHELKKLWSYRHFLVSLVRREFLLNYQQTILGPFWLIFPPLITSITYILVFTKMVGISTGSLPPGLFYFSGIVLWNFSQIILRYGENRTSNSKTIIANIFQCK